MALSNRESAALRAAREATPDDTILVDPKPLFEISPHLYMQFMEPLGTTDPSVEAAWDYSIEDWRRDFVELVRDLSPGCLRWGGIYSWYYKWREGVGSVSSRPAARNYVWGGKESNRIGTDEFVRLCRLVGADPLICVNFLSDGHREFARTADGRNRSSDAAEAAAWVSYCNDPDDVERKRNGVAKPYSVKLWQLGNETSYGNAGFSKDESIAHTIEFARAMRERDLSIQIIGWGDRCVREGGGFWAADLIDRAGDHIDYVAFHMSNQVPDDPNATIRTWAYQRDPEKAWDELRQVYRKVEDRLSTVEQIVRGRSARIRLAITEGHLGLMHNTSPLLQEWLTGVYHARVMNLYQRHGDMVRIATGADFEGNRWTSNAVIVPNGPSYFMPIASIMRLFKRVNGASGIAVRSSPPDLDVVASRTGNRIFLHVANSNFRSSVGCSLAVSGMRVLRGTLHEIAPEDPRANVSMDNRLVFKPVARGLNMESGTRLDFAARSVAAIELECSPHTPDPGA